jgi:hypothetical protein
MRQCEERLIVLRDPAFQTAAGEPSNLTRWQRGAWPDRRLVETGWPRLALVRHGKKARPRGWASVPARLAGIMAAFNVLVQWHGFQPQASGFVPLSIAEFGL